MSSYQSACAFTPCANFSWIDREKGKKHFFLVKKISKEFPFKRTVITIHALCSLLLCLLWWPWLRFRTENYCVLLLLPVQNYCHVRGNITQHFSHSFLLLFFTQKKSIGAPCLLLQIIIKHPPHVDDDNDKDKDNHKNVEFLHFSSCSKVNKNGCIMGNMQLKKRTWHDHPHHLVVETKMMMTAFTHSKNWRRKGNEKGTRQAHIHTCSDIRSSTGIRVHCWKKGDGKWGTRWRWWWSSSHYPHTQEPYIFWYICRKK